MTAKYKISQPAATLHNADDAARPLQESAQSALGFVPEMYRHMAKAPGVLSTYMHGYEQLRENSGLKPAEQEVIFLTISRENGCGCRQDPEQLFQPHQPARPRRGLRRAHVGPLNRYNCRN